MTKTKKASWTWHARLYLLRYEVDPPIPLDVFGTAIRESISRISKHGPSEEDLCDECHTIEENLELAFIACQLTITRVVARCRAFHESKDFQSKYKWGRKDLMERCNAKVRGTPFTRITAIDVFANYAKHQNEWGYNWSKLNHRSRPTAEIVERIGGTPGTPPSMRTGFRKIVGHSHFERVDELSDIIAAWGDRLAAAYERELKAEKLLPKMTTANR